MGKRIFAAVLWFLAVSYVWNLVALLVGVSQGPGLVLGILAGALFAADPLGRIWTPRGHTSAG